MCVPVCSGLGCVCVQRSTARWSDLCAGCWGHSILKVSGDMDQFIDCQLNAELTPADCSYSLLSLSVTRSPPLRPVNTQCQRVNLFCSFLCKR